MLRLVALWLLHCQTVPCVVLGSTRDTSGVRPSDLVLKFILKLILKLILILGLQLAHT